VDARNVEVVFEFSEESREKAKAIVDVLIFAATNVEGVSFSYLSIEGQQADEEFENAWTGEDAWGGDDE
jgi:hypothetical protein